MGNQAVEHVVEREEIKKDVSQDVCGDTRYNIDSICINNIIRIKYYYFKIIILIIKN